MSASMIERKSLEFDSVLPPGLPRVHADRDKVAHVLGNLIGNAIDFTPDGGRVQVVARRSPVEERGGHVRGTWSAHAVDSPGGGGGVGVVARRSPVEAGWIEIGVEDTGIGID